MSSVILTSAKDYGRRDLRTQIRLNPDSQIGSKFPLTRDEWLYDFTENKMVRSSVRLAPAILQVFIELISNASDNVIRSRNHNIPERPDDRSSIEVNMDNRIVTITNYGEPMAVEHWVNKEGDNPINEAPSGCPIIWVPEVIMGTLLSSSNYEGDRHGAGKNGIGGKAGSIFSKQLLLVINDGFRGKRYIQKFNEAMTFITQPEIMDIPIGSQSSTTISYMLDFEYFGIQEYPPETQSLFAGRVASLAYTVKTPTSFNGMVFNNYHIYQYAKLIVGDAVDTGVIYYQLKNPDEEEIRKVKIDGKMLPTPVVKQGIAQRVVIPKIELMIFDTAYTQRGNIISFANSVLTTDGGSHIEKVYDLVIPDILDKVNDVQVVKVDGKKLKGKAARLAAAKKARAKKVDGVQKKVLRRIDAKPQLSFLVSVHVVNPYYSGQTKTKLEVEMPAFPADEKFSKKILSMDMMDNMKGLLKALKLHALVSTDGKKVKNIKLKHGFDANLAGGECSNECVLWIVEGKSALAYAVSFLSKIEKGRDRIGIYPIRGKFLNLSKAEPETIMVNPEIITLKKLLGLREGMDYRVPANYNTLRYGRIMTMTDADPDGSHIKGLLFNFFYNLHPTLLIINYIVDYRTKYLKAHKGKEKKNFYTHTEFEIWKKDTPNWLEWEFEYFKGLGTSDEKDVKEDAANPITVQLQFDDQTSHMFDLAFAKSKSRTNQRKDWVKLYRESMNKDFYITSSMSYTTFFNKEFINYIMESLDRAIPNASDGLKRCHRQILHAIFKKWPSKGKFKKYKVAQLSGYIATCVEYQHNEECLSKTIINMARDFVGSNNLQLLVNKGQFGTRMFGGDDHSAPRYIHTNPTKWPYLIFRKEDNEILEYHDDDGVKVEPRRYYPIVPFALFNGVHGVATAWSTTMLSYNPIEVTNYIMIYIYNHFFATPENKIQLLPLVPWFKGFTGEITLEKDVAKVDRDEELFLERDEDETEESEVTIFSGKSDRVIIEGVIRQHDNQKGATITEIPVGTAVISYNFSLQLMRERKEITSFVDNSTKDRIDFEIYGMQNPTLHKLRLIRKIRLSNMVLLGDDGTPIRFPNIEEYISYFIKNRYKKYEERRVNRIKKLEENIATLTHKARFLIEVTEGRLEVRKRSQEEIMKDMDVLGIPRSLLKEIKVYDLTKEKLKKILDKKELVEKEYADYIKIHPAKIWYDELTELRDELMKDPDNIRQKMGVVKYPSAKEEEIKEDETTDSAPIDVEEYGE